MLNQNINVLNLTKSMFIKSLNTDISSINQDFYCLYRIKFCLYKLLVGSETVTNCHQLNMRAQDGGAAPLCLN